MKKYYVYSHLNPVTKDIFYIGLGVLKRGWEFKSGRSSYYKNYINKWGEPVVNIIKENLTKEEACFLEIELISKYGRKGLDPQGILINRSIGGELGALGHRFTEEQKENLIQGKLGSKYNINSERVHGNKNKPKPVGFMNEDTKNKISAKNKGKKHSTPHSRKGIPRSEEVRLKISISNSKPKPKDFGAKIKENRNHKLIGEKNMKRINQFNDENILINSFCSIKEALISLGKSPNNSSITACLKGRQKKAFGYKWEFQN